MNELPLKVLFIDRDGTIIYEPDDFQVDDLKKVKFVPNVIRVLNELRNEGYELVMVSNQDGLGTESFPQEQFELCQNFMLNTLYSEGVSFREIFICPHFETDNCDCRKPKIGLLSEFLTHNNIDTSRSYVIGDRDTDIELANKLKLPGIKIDPHNENAWIQIKEDILSSDSKATVTRTTNETNITSKVDLSSDRVIDIKTGIGFYDHMLEQLAKHSGISVQIECDGDLHIDEHHTVEDVAITLGDALRRALSTKAGIERYGFTLPMDDALCTVSMDLSGRPYFKFEGEFKREIIGGLPTELIIHFFYTLSQNLKANIHINVNGDDDHHKAESCFKCFGRAFSQAINKSSKSGVPSTKGSL